MNNRPPKIAGWLLKRLYFYNLKYALFEDLSEEYMNLYESKGRLHARLWFWAHTTAAIFESIKLSIYRGIIMFKNYLKVTLRNILKHHLYSLINISGLAIGITCAILIMLYVDHETGYNKFHENADNLYRVNEYFNVTHSVLNIPRTVTLTGPTLKEEYPEIIDFARYYYMSNTLLSFEGIGYYESSILAADRSFFDMFSFPLLKGDVDEAFKDPNSILIDEDTAEKYFGNDDPIGKILNVETRGSFTVRGVLQNVPAQSNIQFKIVVPWEYLKNFSWYRERWDDHLYYTYIMLLENVEEGAFEEKIRDVFREKSGGDNVDLHLESLKDIHLHSEISTEGSNNIGYIYFLTILGVFILLIACMNFMNMTTARSSQRAKEIGMRKVVGGEKKNIIIQFLAESVFISFLSLLVALILLKLVLPYFSNFTGKELSLSLTGDPYMFIGIIAVSLITGLIAGSYPAFYLSSFRPVTVLKGTLKSGYRGSLFRRILVIFQFTGSVILIASTITVYSQIEYMLAKNLGWNKEHLVYINFRGDSHVYSDVLKNELTMNPAIRSVATSYSDPARFRGGTSGIDWAGKDPELSVNIRYNFIDFDYFDTVEYELTKGRKFSRDISTDRESAFIVNESLARIMGDENIIGLDIEFWGFIPGRVIGVVKDFHFNSMHNEIQPMLFKILNTEATTRFAIVKVEPAGLGSTLEYIADTWKKVVPDYPLVAGFVDEEVERMYQDDRKTGKMLQSFAGLAVFIGCMGLFGLVSYAAEKRKKEIGIRKTLGASISLVVHIIMKEFIFLIFIANAIAWPAAYIIMKNWLNTFAYRIEMGPAIFLLSGLIILVIALLTVIYQSVKAAIANPVDSLKYE